MITTGFCLMTILLGSAAQSRMWSRTPNFNFAEYLDAGVVVPGDIDIHLSVNVAAPESIERYALWIAEQDPQSPDIRTHMTNLAVMLADADRYEESIAHLEMMLRLPGRFKPIRQSPRFRFLGDLRFHEGDYEAAIDAYRTAQQLIHLHAGVLDPEQVRTVDRVIRAKLNIMRKETYENKIDTLTSADLDQRFTLYLNEKQHGRNSANYAERLLDVADYMRETALSLRLPPPRRPTPSPKGSDEERGSRQYYPDARAPADTIAQERLNRLRRATQYYKAAIDVLEDTLGPDNPALIIPLTSLSDTLNRRGQYRQSRNLRQRSIDIALEAPLDLADRVNIIVSAADSFHRRGEEIALKYYQMAWNLLSEEGETRLRDRVLGEPRLISGQLQAIRLRKVPTQSPTLIVRYNVKPTGETSEILVIESNINTVRERLWLSQIERLVYRPKWTREGPRGYSGLELHARFILPSPNR